MRELLQALGRATGAGWICLLTLGVAPGCLSGPSAEELVATGFRTPHQTLASFQTFVRADLPAREYRCFSLAFRERNGLSALSYGEVRDELFRRQPWLRWIARAKVIGEPFVGEAEHWLDLETLGRTVRVKLVREDFYEIHSGDMLLFDGDANFDSMVRRSGAEDRLSVRLTAEVPQGATGEVTEVLIARQWKIDDVRELSEDDPATANPAP